MEHIIVIYINLLQIVQGQSRIEYMIVIYIDLLQIIQGQSRIEHMIVIHINDRGGLAVSYK